MISLPPLDEFFGWFVLSVLSLSGVLFVAEAVGFLPDSVTRWINRNRLAQTMMILNSFGIDVSGARRRNRAASLEKIAPSMAKDRVQAVLRKYCLRGRVTVGQTFRKSGRNYYDIMGATSNIANARSLARDLSAKWRDIISDPGSAVEDDFQFVATPKAGSPLLGAAFAELVGVPVALHTREVKFESDGHAFNAVFDCASVPPPGSRALVVDDSSTGGGKIIALVSDLRRLGYKVDDALVIFEPQLKVSSGQGAAERLGPLGIRLHAIVQT